MIEVWQIWVEQPSYMWLFLNIHMVHDKIIYAFYPVFVFYSLFSNLFRVFVAIFLRPTIKSCLHIKPLSLRWYKFYGDWYF
jgi:hypothetical protein